MASGGLRVGAPGKDYPNRSDMREAPRATQPVQTATGQPYGVAGQQAQAQQAIPLPNAAGQMQSPATPPPAPQQSAPPIPGQMGGSLLGPTQMPNQPVTHGAASGPGAGPEALAPQGPNNNISLTLQALAAKSGSPELQALAQRAQSLDQ